MIWYALPQKLIEFNIKNWKEELAVYRICFYYLSESPSLLIEFNLRGRLELEKVDIYITGSILICFWFLSGLFFKFL